MARMVPMGMERWASFRSPDRLEPAMIPGDKEKKIILRNGTVNRSITGGIT